jgi:ABC-2 type transport system permease protein
VTRLVWVELRRYAARRAVQALGLLAIVAMLFATVLVFINSSDSPEEIRAGQQAHQRAIQECELQQEQAPPEFRGDERCEDVIPVQEFDPRFHLAELREVLQGLSFLFVILAMALGATFVGAEWGAGTMTTILTWEPRRGRVLTAKVIAGLIFVALAVVAALAVLLALMTPVALMRGSTAGVDGAWLADVAGIVARSALICALTAVMGMAMAFIARVTAAVIIISFVYFAVLENVIRGFRPNWMRWLPGNNMVLYMLGGREAGYTEISETRALITVIGYAVILSLVAFALFRRRDVT